MRSAPILPSLASSRRSDVKALNNCSTSSPIQKTNGSRKWRARVSQLWGANCARIYTKVGYKFLHQ